MSQEIKSETVSVPWTGLDVLLFLGVWLIAQVACGIFVASVSPLLPQPLAQAATDKAQEQAGTNEGKKHYGHPIQQLVKQSINSPMVFLIAFLGAVVAAPLIEEFLFRLLLQGWLEAKCAQFRVPCASGVAITAVSLFFAKIHAGNKGILDGQTLFYLLCAGTVTSLLIFFAGLIYLAEMRNVNAASCLFGAERFSPTHFFRYAGYCLLTLVFIFGISFILNTLCPDTNTDPIPLFFFSLLLGTLYSRTRNLAYCIFLHALLNLTSLILIWCDSANVY